MKNNYLKIIEVLMRLTFYGIFIQILCLGMLYASTGEAQKSKSLKEVYVELNTSEATLMEVFSQIESQTGFYFNYDKKSIDKRKKVNLDGKAESVEQLLIEIGHSAKLHFRRINNNISVYRAIGPVDRVQVLVDMQDVEMSGKVTDENGEGLPGASVVVKGTAIGTTTNLDGQYKLSVPEQSTLVVSFVGYKTSEIVVGNQSVIDVQMELDAEQLEEVVVIGYGTTTKRKLVGAVSSMNTKELEQTPFANITQALQGQVPGLIVQSSGGQPGKVPQISIRGAGSPLYVIDGVIIDKDDNYSFASLNMEDIESISFLKDASSTAVYGSRAGNGIVLVKTKRGQSGKLNVKYAFNYQLSRPSVLPKRLNSYEFAKIQNLGSLYDGVNPFYTEEQLNTILNGSDQERYPNSDWQELSLKSYAPEQKHNLSLSGGGDVTDFYVSLGYFDQGGLLKSEAISLDRMNIRSNVTTRVEKVGLELGFNLNASLQNTRHPALGEWTIWNHMARIIPIYKAFNEDGTYAEGVNHPLAQNDYEAGYLKERQKFINTQLTVNWKVPSIKGLSTGLMANYRDSDSYSKKWELLAPQYHADGTIYPVSKPALDIMSGYGNKYDLIYNISYARNFGDHGIDVTLAYNRIKSDGESVEASRRDFLSSAVDQIFAGPSLGQGTDGRAYNSANEGYVGRFKYDFASKYILEFSFRYDGNDNFAPSQRWGFFPSVSGAWIISDETFMEPLYEKNILSTLKLRASYGSTGLTDGVNRHGYLPVYNLKANAYTIGNNLVNGFTEGPLVNAQALTWFDRKSINYGFDFGLLQNKLEGSFDYFYYKTSGYLQSPELEYSGTLGKPLPQITSNSVQRRAGFEFRLDYKKSVNEFFYSVGINYSYFNQLWEQLDTENEVNLKNPYTRVTHQTDFYQRTNSSDGGLYVSDGLFQSEEQILNSPRPLASTETQLGDLVYIDANGDGKIDPQDRRRIGLPTFPHGTYGLNFSLGYKGWSMSGLIQGTGDRYTALGNGYQKNEAIGKTLDFQQDFWTIDNTGAFFPRVSHISGVNGGNNQLDSDYFILNAKYIRLKTLRIGYDLKSTILKDLNAISAFNIFVSGVNFLTISDVLDYFDPEDVINSDNSVNGFTGSAYPLQKTFAFGLNVSF